MEMSNDDILAEIKKDHVKRLLEKTSVATEGERTTTAQPSFKQASLRIPKALRLQRLAKPAFWLQ